MTPRVFFVPAVAMAVAACATAGLTPVDEDRLEIPVDTTVLRVLPPHGPNWYRLMPGAQGHCTVVFHKLMPNRARQAARGHTYAASARSSRELGERRFADAEAFAAFVTEQIRLSGQDETRNRLLRWRAVPDTTRAPLCVRYEAEVEDRGVPGWGDTPFLITARGYRCVHPSDPTVVVDVSASERRLPGDPTWALNEEVQPFFEGFSFRALP
jgi:hypothetical protein